MPPVLALATFVSVIGLPLGYVLGRARSRLFRRLAVATLFALPLIVPAWEFFQTPNPSDDLGPAVWAVLSVFVYLLPIAAWELTILLGYNFGREGRLNRQAKEDGIIR